MQAWPAQTRNIFNAAWLYYVRGVKQEEIAKRLSMSRANVALYLKKAREMGLVHLRMEDEYFRSLHQAKMLEETFGLDMVSVVPSLGPDTFKDVAWAVWMALEPHLSDATRLGVAWGRMIYEIASVIPKSNYPDLSIMQLCGNVGGTPYGTRPDTSTFRIARQLGGEPRNLYAPMVVSSAGLADILRQEAVISDHMEELKQCEIVLFSPGICHADSHIVTSGTVTREEIQRYYEAGARAVIAGRLIKQDGHALTEIDNRVIALPLDELKAVPRRFVVAAGRDKVEPVLATLNGGLATHLIIDEACADELVATSGTLQQSNSRANKGS